MPLTRRELLKLGGVGAAAGVVAAAGGDPAALPGLVAAPRRHGGRILDGHPSACGGCPRGCAVLGAVDRGRLVRVWGDPGVRPSQRGVCPRGAAAPNLVEDVDRVLRPLRRTGPRGSGRFAEATWQQALAELGEALRAPPQTDVQPCATLGPYDLLGGLAAERWAAGLGSPHAWHPRTPGSANVSAACRSFWGASGAVPDLEHAELALLFGANPYAASPAAPRPGGASWIVFDPRCSETAGATGCEWVPVLPGTDGVIALSLAAALVGEKLHAAAFMARWANVADEALARYLQTYLPERVAAHVGISAERLRTLARRFAAARTSTIVLGDAAARQTTGRDTARSILLLAAVAGRLETPGGLLVPRAVVPVQPLGAPRPAPRPTSAELVAALGGDVPLTCLQRSGASFGLLLVWGSCDPLWAEPARAANAALLGDTDRIRHLVVHSRTLDETARWADWVLPAAAWPERWGLSCPAVAHRTPPVFLRQPLVAAKGEARCAVETFVALSQAVGGPLAQAFSFASAADFAMGALRSTPGLRSGGGLAALRASARWEAPDSAAPIGFASGREPATDSEKLQLSLPGEGSDSAALPTLWPPNLRSPAQGLRLVLFHGPFLRSAQDASAKWLAELAGAGTVWLAPPTARRLRLRDGQRVAVETSSGRIEGTLVSSEGVHPGVVAVLAGGGHRYGSRTALGRPYRSVDTDSRRLPAEPGPVGGANPLELLAATYDPVGHGVSYAELVQRVQAAKGGRS